MNFRIHVCLIPAFAMAALLSLINTSEFKEYFGIK